MKLEVLEEVDQISLMWLKSLLAGELVHSELLYNLKKINLLDEFAPSTLEK